MNENKDFTWQEDRLPEEPAAEQEIRGPAEELPQEAAAEFSQESQVPQEEITEKIAEEINKEINEEIAETEEIAEEINREESLSGSYRGNGTGRKESPFADSPYVMPRNAETFRNREEMAKPVKKQRKKFPVVRKILAWTAALALVAGSCAITAHTVNSKWENRVDAMEASFARQLEALKQQVDGMSPANTGVSVSGTVGLAGGMTASQVYAENVRSVVLIEATVTAELYGQTSTGHSTGSGFILSQDGYVVTNFHVVEGATSVDVVLFDGTAHPAALVGYDSTNDLAVLKVEAKGLDAVVLGSSGNLIVGDQVVAIGNPLGELTATLTVGYVSAKERTISTDGTVINMIQTDAAINSGNSGGPLFNMKGEVVGITTAKYSGSTSSGATIEGIGFAIPMDDVREEIDELIRFGYIKSAYLGVMVQNMDASVAAIYGLPVGAYVAGVEEGYCAANAGIQAKDIIVAVGDDKVETLTDLTRALREYEPGEKARVTVYRAGQILEFIVVLDERPASAG